MTLRRRPRRVLVCATVVIVASISVTIALAGESPSTAPTLEPGTPFSDQTRTRGERYAWFKLPERLLPSDTVQLAVESSTPNYGTQLRLCLEPATDDYGQKAAEDACGDTGYTGSVPHVDVVEGKARVVLAWDRGATTGFVTAISGCGACGGGTFESTVTVTLEKQIHQVRLGIPKATHNGRDWKLRTSVRLLDNSVVPDGSRGFALVTVDGKQPVRLRGATRNGVLTLGFKAPSSSKRAVARVCAYRIHSNQPTCAHALTFAL